MAAGPLNGLKVLEMAGLGPTPFAGMVLSDMGADVVRIDRPGAPDATPFPILDRGRRSVALDLKSADGVGTALKLVAAADILIEGFRPGVMERLGEGPEAALARNPKLVYGRMTGWGQDGPYAGMAGHDVNYVALTGALSLIGPAERPVMPLNLVGDFGGGGMFLLVGVLAALQHARLTGEGQVVDAVMVDGVSTLMAGMWGSYARGALREAREANVANGAAHYMGAFACADGAFITLAAYEPQFYRLLLEKTGLADDPGFAVRDDPAQWPAQKARMAAVIARKTRAEWCALLENTDVCFAPVLSLSEALDHPHNVARNVFVEADGMRQPAPAPRFARTPGAIQGPPARPGQHHAAVLRDWGVDEEKAAGQR